MGEGSSRGGGLALHIYQKTLLWSEVFALKSDSQVRREPRH
jgi:hypothetical protein